MKRALRSIARFVGFSALAFGLIATGSGIARADSIAYNVLGTFSNGQQLSGQVTWNTASNSVIQSNFSLSSSMLSASCNSAAGGCGLVFTGFWGTGTFATAYEILAGLFQPSGSLFALTVAGSSGIRILATNVSWTKVAVPEEPITAQLLLVLLGFAFLIKRGVLSPSRKPTA